MKRQPVSTQIGIWAVAISCLTMIGCGGAPPAIQLAPHVSTSIGTPAPSSALHATATPPPTTAVPPSCSQQFLPKPDPKCTPGAADPRVTQENIHMTICVSGYTKTVRPSSHYTDQLKSKQIHDYGYTQQGPSWYEEDHEVPLEVGGDPAAVANLWPEPRYPTGPEGLTASSKDQVENALHAAVCRDANPVPLATAQQEVARDWVAVYHACVLGQRSTATTVAC